LPVHYIFLWEASVIFRKEAALYLPDIHIDKFGEKIMVKPKPKENKELNLSDWIQFLISVQAHIISLITGGIIATLLSMVYLFTWYLDKNDDLGTKLVMIVGTLIIVVLFYILYYPTTRLNRAKKLLKQIMNEEIIDVKEIKNIWFENKKSEKMKQNPRHDIIEEKNLDWVSYLMGISSTYDNYLIGIAALIITGSFGAIEVNLWLKRPTVEALCTIIIFLAAYLISFYFIKRQRKKFEVLAESIMLGNINNLSEIKEQYKKIKNKKRKERNP
jgi:hypothetical protein